MKNLLLIFTLLTIISLAASAQIEANFIAVPAVIILNNYILNNGELSFD